MMLPCGHFAYAHYDHECQIIQITTLHLPEYTTEMGREGNTILTARLSSEVQVYRLWACGTIEVSINHSKWVEYLTFSPKTQEEQPEKP